MGDCETQGGCVYVKVRSEDTVRYCKNCGQTEPSVLNEGEERVPEVPKRKRGGD